MEEETLSLILHGCNLVKHLESNLPHFSNQPNVLLNSCDEIVRTFKSAMDRLNSNNTNNPSSSNPDTVLHGSDLDAVVQEWLRTGYTRTMDLFQSQFSIDKNPFSKTCAMEPMELGLEIPATATTSGLKLLEGSESDKSPVAQRSRKRKGGVDKHTVRVAAPRIGNTEIPPEDGFTWRKYGQKDILGSTFPRGYYRCTHKNFYGCSAKKQVQRLDHDHNVFEVTYYGDHTCHISSTAPSIRVSTTDMDQEKLETLPQSPPPHFASIPLSMDSEATTRKDTNTSMDLHLQMYKDFNIGGSSGSCSAAAGSSHVRGAKEAEFPVVDLADSMFNSGSSTNSFNSIFSFIEDK